MQKVYLDNFNKEILDVESYIKYLSLIDITTKENITSTEKSFKKLNIHLKKIRTEKKLFEYKAIIISLYGTLEKHINIWIKEHINELSKIIIDYRRLPQNIRDNHFNLSIKLISMIIENRFSKYENLRKEDILKTLNDCIISPNNYKLNNDAFSPNSGNLKHSKISEALKLLDINLQDSLLKNELFSEYLKNKLKKTSEQFKKIDNLVELRNEISHGEDIDNILGTSEFPEYIEYLRKYGKAIFEIMSEKEIEYELIYYKEIKKENIIDIFNKKILAFQIENYTLNKGDYLIIKTQKEAFLKREILDIQLNKTSYKTLTINQETRVSISIKDKVLKDTQTFYIKK